MYNYVNILTIATYMAIHTPHTARYVVNCYTLSLIVTYKHKYNHLISGNKGSR